MPSHDLYKTQIIPFVKNCRYSDKTKIIPVVKSCRYSDHFIEFVDCIYIQFISSKQTTYLITSTVISAFSSDKTKQIVILTKNAIDKLGLEVNDPKNLRQKVREFPKLGLLMTHGYDIDLDDFETPLIVISK